MDPTILKPVTRFARPDHFHSRSPSRSPARRQQLISHELDPLLANLSPTSTLEALQSTNVVSAEAGTQKRALLESVAVVSTSDRAWGIKAALAGKKVREWYRELETWPWPTASDGTANGFEPFSAREMESEGGQTIMTGERTKGDIEYWGHLPAHLVQECEDRIESIMDDMDTLELEELKEHVRATHHLSNQKRSEHKQSRHDDRTEYRHMDDFTAVITATIMQTLPHISRLHSLMGIWSTRLAVLRQVPGFLDCLQKNQTAMKAAWNVVEPWRSGTSGKMVVVSRDTFSTIRDVLQKQIHELGHRLDYMLDALEGREDTLPDQWIEDMEALETEYETWVVETERHVLENELNTARNIDNHHSNTKSRSTLQVLTSGEADQGLSQSTETDPEVRSDNGNKSDSTNSRKGRSGDVETTDVRGSAGPGVSDRPSTSGSARSVPSNGSGESPTFLKKILASRCTTPSNFDGSSPASSPFNSLKGSPVDISDNGGLDMYEPGNGQRPLESDADMIPGRRSKSRPISLVLKKPRASVTSNPVSEFSSDASFPGSSTSDYFSDMSSPEIQQAFRAEYFGAPVEVTTPSFSQQDPSSPTDTVSRNSSQRTARGRQSLSMDYSANGITSPIKQRSRASSFVPGITIPENEDFAGQWLTSSTGNMSHQRTRSASMQSFSVIPRNEVQHITIKRSYSYSKASPTSPKDAEAPVVKDPAANLPRPQQPTSHEKLNTQTQPLNCDFEPTPTSQRSEYEENEDGHTGALPQHLTADTEVGPRDPPPLPSKSQHRFENVTDLISTPVKIRHRRKSDTSPPKPSSRISSPPKNDVEQLEARISSILTSIPAHIRLTSGPEPDAPEVPYCTPDPLTPLSSGRNAPRLSRAQTTTPTPLPSMTLAPAQPRNARSRPQGGDSDIKLYHLHQSGKEAPVKLFVRLVGEAGERVMVRIGGGWADLGEYLKEYASHHGKRSVSDGRFAIQELPSSPIASSPAPGNASAPGSRPGSSHVLGAETTELSALRHFEGTPYSDVSLRPGSAHSWKEDESPLGGAGPKSKKSDVSPTKQAWVDGMMEQARNAATADRARDVGDLGKVGGTRRVYLRSKTAGA